MADIRTRPWMVLLVMAALLAGIAGCGRKESYESGKLLVAASIAPMYNFSREVGGEQVQVELLVHPGTSPHTYQLTSNQMELLSKASVLVLNGAGLEFWADKAVDAADNPDLVVVRTAEGLQLIDTPDEHEGHDAEATGNPHVWLDPLDAIHQVEKIESAFVKVDPDNEAVYQKNAEEYVKRLQALDSYIKEQTADLPSKRFVAFHSAWVYFARRYGFEQVAVVEESPGREPSAQHIRSIIDTVRKADVKVVIAEPQFSPKAARVIAEETGARVVTLDPLGEPPDYDYIKTMRNNVKKLTEALK